MHAFDVPTLSLHRGGEEIVIDGEGLGGWLWKKGSEGLGLAPVQRTFAELATGGAVLRHSRYQSREIFLPVHLTAESYRALTPLRRQIEDLLDPMLGEVEIRLDDGRETRSAFGLYSSGLEGGFGRTDLGYGWQNFGLTFTCPDPWWYGEEHVIDTSVGDAFKPFITASSTESFDAGPFFPVVLAPSTVQGAYSIDVEGDGPAYPVWTITGPGEDLLIRNQSTGQRIFIEGVVDETITIDTRPQVQDVSTPTLTNGQMWERVSLDSDLFALQPGRNRIRMEMVNSTPSSQVRLSYRERWKAGH